MNFLKALNLGLAFFLELFMLAAFVWGGFSLNASMLIKVLVGIGVPILVVVLWSMYFAPNSGNRIPLPWLQLAVFALYSVAALVLTKGGEGDVAIKFLCISFVNLSLAIIWKQ